MSNVQSHDSTVAGAPADEIEITPEMIEAGVSMLWGSGAVETPMEKIYRSLVRKIFVAMYLAGRFPWRLLIL
ncbi:MAG: hypothetical protein DLM68_12150 [Hyphomicrobiales bacterium]|nr:MAG: hypothetical protein DLM68_12150 [Hyphomicrobiales bacterium]